MNSKIIKIIDLTDFHQARPNNYKEIDINEAIPDTPNLQISRYEVLNYYIRKVHFDFDGLPDTPEGREIPDNFVKAWAKWMYGQSLIPSEEIKYVKTTNSASATHKGFSSHIICYEYSMDYQQIKNSIIKFIETTEGSQFKNYVDVAIYTRLRLFKLPNFIGIPMDNPDNYHRLDPRDLNKEHYIIQHIEGLTHITSKFYLTKSERRQSKKAMHSNGNGELYIQIARAIEQAFIDKISKTYNGTTINEQLQSLINNPNISETDKTILQKYTPYDESKAPLINSLITLVKTKYNIQ